MKKEKQLQLFDPIVEDVRQKLLDRSQTGIKKYGTTLEQNNTDDYLQHLQDELLDGANYVQKLIRQRRYIKNLINMYPNDAELGENIRKIYK